jgi:REP element-mobilizing transposase RayT
MANTYTQLYVHFVFAVYGRYSLIGKRWRNELYKYISGIINEQGHKAYIINGMPDHIHILASMNPRQSPSDLMLNVKKSSSAWINKNRYSIGKFEWQAGFGAFSCSRSRIDEVITYIRNQEDHHTRKSFKNEYLELLKQYEVDYNEEYLFHDPT